MRVALVTPGYAPALGGVESAVTALARGLADLGCDVQVWAQASSSGSEQEDAVSVRRFRAVGPSNYQLAPRLWAHTVRHSHGVDLVHAHGYHSLAAVTGAIPRGDTPWVFSGHYHGGGHTAAARAMHIPYGPVGRRLFSNAHAVVAVSAAERDLVQRDFPFAADRIRVIHHGVDVGGLSAAEPFDGEPPTALVMGRLEPYKNVDLAIDAFSRARSAGQLVILGDGTDRGRLEALAQASPRAHQIRFLGRVSEEALRRWQRTARVVLSMSGREAFGLVALEGACAGARVLLSDIPAHEEVAALIGPERAGVVPRSDPAAVVTQLDRALEHPAGDVRPLRSWRDSAREHLACYEAVLRR